MRLQTKFMMDVLAAWAATFITIWSSAIWLLYCTATSEMSASCRSEMSWLLKPLNRSSAALNASTWWNLI